MYVSRNPLALVDSFSLLTTGSLAGYGFAVRLVHLQRHYLACATS